MTFSHVLERIQHVFVHSRWVHSLTLKQIKPNVYIRINQMYATNKYLLIWIHKLTPLSLHFLTLSHVGKMSQMLLTMKCALRSRRQAA